MSGLSCSCLTTSMNWSISSWCPPSSSSCGSFIINIPELLFQINTTPNTSRSPTLPKRKRVGIMSSTDLSRHNNYQMIKSTKPNRRKTRRGKSEFIKEKLDEPYEPVPRYHKEKLMSFGNMPDDERFVYRAREENEICNRALRNIREGSELVIDWSTRSNFHVMKDKLPRLNTEPTKRIQNQLTPMSSSESIASKRIKLARLLHQRQKKHYMRTKNDEATELLLFDSKQLNESKLKPKDWTHSFHNSRSQSFSREKPNILDVQTEIFSHCRLKILKEQLKAKFQEIRQMYNRSGQEKQANRIRFDDT